VESELVDKYSGQMKSDILVAGHHGSKSSSSTKFLSAVSARLILISAAESFRLKLPSPDAMKRMSNTGAVVLRTDIDHAIEIVITPEKAEARTFTGRMLTLKN
jgi:competence protein ComEC